MWNIVFTCNSQHFLEQSALGNAAFVHEADSDSLARAAYLKLGINIAKIIGCSAFKVDGDIWLDGKDRWTIRTRDGKPAAHFEHTIAVGKGKAEILSSFDEVERIEGKQY